MMEWAIRELIENGNNKELVENIIMLDNKITLTFWILLSMIILLQMVNFFMAWHFDKKLKK